jgi:hypothetical protein
MVAFEDLKVAFSYSRHKSDGELGMWGFELVRSGTKQELELRSEDSHFEAEIDANGTLLVFRHIDYYNFEIVLANAKTPKPLDNEACRAQIEKAAIARHLLTADDSTSGGGGATEGVLMRSTTSFVAYCGVYTKRVWFTPPREERRRR